MSTVETSTVLTEAPVREVRDVTVDDAIVYLWATGSEEYRPAIDELQQLSSMDLFEWARDFGSRTGYRLPEYLDEVAQAEARRRGWSTDHLIEESVTEWLVAKVSDTYQAWREMLEQAGHPAPPTYRAWLQEQAGSRPCGAGNGGDDE